MAEKSGNQDTKSLELAVIGFCLCWPEKMYLISEIREIHFLNPGTRKAWTAISNLTQVGGASAVSSASVVASKMQDAGMTADQAVAILAESNDHCPQHPIGIEAITAQLTAIGMRRSMSQISDEIKALAGDTDADSDKLAELASQIVIENTKGVTGARVGTMAEEMQAELEALDSGLVEAGIPTGLSELTRIIGGFRGGEVIVVASRPSMGKSSLMSTFAASLAHEQGIPGVIFSLEMPKRMCAQRILCNVSGVNLEQARLRVMNQKTRERYSRWARELAKAPMYFSDGSITADRICSTARRLYHEVGARWAIIDYLQLIDHDQKGGESLTNAIGRTSRKIKCLSVSLDIPVVVLAQVNRECERRDNKRPRMSDLRDSGSIEQDADTIMFIYRDGYYAERERGEPEQDIEEAELIIAKQRNGPTGTARVTWVAASASFKDSTSADVSNPDAW